RLDLDFLLRLRVPIFGNEIDRDDVRAPAGSRDILDIRRSLAVARGDLDQVSSRLEPVVSGNLVLAVGYRRAAFGSLLVDRYKGNTALFQRLAFQLDESADGPRAVRIGTAGESRGRGKNRPRE